MEQRLDRRASDGKYCIWIEPFVGEDYPLTTEYTNWPAAYVAAKKFMTDPETTYSYCDIYVYDSDGCVAYHSEWATALERTNCGNWLREAVKKSDTYASV